MPLLCMMSSSWRISGCSADAALLNQSLQGCQQKGERSAQFMTDIGEKAAFDSIHLHEFLIGLFEFLSVLAQFEA